MKKRFVVVAAVIGLLSVIPAVSFGAAVQSRWDMTIGGYIKFDIGWADKGVGADYQFGPRKSAKTENVTDEYGNNYMALGESRFNFLIKGPDTFGAKTSALLEGDFRGPSPGSGTPTSYGVFSLRHAWMRFDWANDTLLVGQYWQPWEDWGVINLVGFGEFGHKPNRYPQIMYAHRFSPMTEGKIGIMFPTSAFLSTGGANVVNEWTRSMLPAVTGSFKWQSNALGKVGQQRLMLFPGFMIDWEKKVYGTAGTAAAPTKFSDETIMGWVVNLCTTVPIIPEKSATDKTGGLMFAGLIMASKNVGNFHGGWAGVVPQATDSAYNRSGAGANFEPVNYQAPKQWGWYGQLQYYFTDQWSLSGGYSFRSNDLSKARAKQYPNDYTRVDQYFVTLLYDPSPAVRLGLEVTHIYNRFADKTVDYENYGKLNAARIGAWYFF